MWASAQLTHATRSIVQLNAGEAIYVEGLATSLEDGATKADQVIASARQNPSLIG